MLFFGLITLFFKPGNKNYTWLCVLFLPGLNNTYTHYTLSLNADQAKKKKIMGSSKKKKNGQNRKWKNQKNQKKKRFSGQPTRYTRIQCILINLCAVLTQCCCCCLKMFFLLLHHSYFHKVTCSSWYVSMFVCFFRVNAMTTENRNNSNSNLITMVKINIRLRHTQL